MGEGLEEVLASAGTSVRLDGSYSPAVLGGLLDMSASNVYQLSQRGIIPANCSYRTAISSYINYWKTKATSKTGSSAALTAVRKSELDRARTELTLLQVQEKRGELIAKEEMENAFEPLMVRLISELVSITKNHPETLGEINKILESMHLMGKQMTEEGHKRFTSVIDERIKELDDLEEEAAVPDIGEEPDVDE